MNVCFTTAHAEESSKCSTGKHLSRYWKKVPSHAHHTFDARRDMSRCTHTNGKSRRDPKSKQESYSVRNEYSWSIKKFGITSRYEETKQPNVTSERQNPNTPFGSEMPAGPSTRNSLDPKEGRFSKDYGADRQRLQISDPHFDKFLHPATFACWKIRFKTEACTCSQFPTEAMLCIKRSGDG